VQTGAPVVQAIVPVRHGLVGVQALPAAQAAHEPLLHTMFAPQTVPFACALPVSMHDSTPLAEQIVCPTRHGLAGVQTPPPVHEGTSAPASTEPPVPATDPPELPAIDPAVPALPPRPAVPATPPRPPAPVTPPAPPAPAAPTPPSGNSGCSRRPHPRLDHPRRTVTHTSRLNIVTPVR